MNLEKFQMETKTFYKLGIVSFLIIGLCQIGGLILNWGYTNIFGIIQAIFFGIFYFGMAALFNYLLSLEPKETEEYASEDIDEIIKKVKNEKIEAH